MTTSRIPGHTLRSEGAPYDGRRSRIGRAVTTGGAGRGLCSCGELSAVLPSAAQRRAWHRDHKALQGRGATGGPTREELAAVIYPTFGAVHASYAAQPIGSQAFHDDALDKADQILALRTPPHAGTVLGLEDRDDVIDYVPTTLGRVSEQDEEVIGVMLSLFQSTSRTAGVPFEGTEP